MPSSCPTAVDLESLLRGTLSPSDSAAVEHHLCECRSCRQRLDALTGGNAASLRMEGTGDDPCKSPRLRGAMDWLKAATPLAAEGNSQEIPAACGTRLHYLGDYEILNELGRGGMGVVYRARQLSLQRDVALKVILAGQLASASVVRRFQVEAEAAAKLDHPHIVPIFEVGQHEGHHFYSMKLVEGGSLAERLSGSLRYAPREGAQLVAAVARAVHYAHQHGVLHRDLKPGNILLDGEGCPQVADFGLAKLTEHDSNLTRSAAIMGSPNYMAPEVAAGKAKEVTTSADVYSLGAILYELLTGRPPFQEETVAATLREVTATEARQPRTLNPAVPRDLETITLKCLEKNPVRRYRSAFELAEDLERFTCGEPVAARPVTPVERVWRWCRRKPALAAALAALLLVFGAGLTGIVWQWQRAQSFARNESNQRKRAEGESERSRQMLTRLEIQQADSLLQTGDSARALAHLARALRRQPNNRVATERLLSALTLRRFPLPVAPLRHGPALDSWKTNQPSLLRQAFPFCFVGSVVAANFNPVSSRVVTASEDGTARIWNALTGQPIGEPLRHSAEVLWAEFSPDGQRVVTASMDFTARVWDANTGAPISPPLTHSNIVWHAAFSPDGRQVISASQDQTARIWDATTGALLRTPLDHPKPVIYAAFSPDGRRIVTAERGLFAYVRDSGSGEVVRKPIHQFFSDSAMPFPQFNGRGDQLLTIHNIGAWLFDVEDRAVPKSFSTDGPVRAVAFLADPRRIAVAAGNRVRVMDIATERSVMSLSHGDNILSLQASAGGNQLLTASADRTVRLWDFRNGGRALATLNHEAAVVAATLSADQRRAVSVPASDTAWLWQMQVRPSVVVCTNTEAVQAAWFSPDGNRVVGLTPHFATRWEASTGRELSSSSRQSLAISAHVGDVHFGNAGARVVSPNLSGIKARIYDPTTPDASVVVLAQGKTILDAQFSPDGRYVVTASIDGTATVWDAASGKRLLILAHKRAVNSVSFSPDGRWIATGSADKTARVWNATNGEAITEPLRHEGGVKFVLFDPKGEKLATACDDNTIHLWSPRSGVELTPRLAHLVSLQHKRAWCFSPDGSRLATAAGASVQLWDTATGKSAVGPLEMGTLVTAVCFSPDGRRIAVAKLSGIAVILDAATGQAVSEPLQHDRAVSDVRFSPDGARVLTSSLDKTVRIWPVPMPPMPVPTWLPEIAEAIAGQRLNDQDVGELVPVNALYLLRQKLTSEPASDYYRQWARAWLADADARANPPSRDNGASR